MGSGTDLRVGEVQPRDVVVAASLWLHSNGYSLVRQVTRRELEYRTSCAEMARPGESCCAAGSHPRLLALIDGVEVPRSVRHGGGMDSNLARVMPGSCEVRIDRTTWATTGDLGRVVALAASPRRPRGPLTGGRMVFVLPADAARGDPTAGGWAGGPGSAAVAPPLGHPRAVRLSGPSRIARGVVFPHNAALGRFWVFGVVFAQAAQGARIWRFRSRPSDRPQVNSRLVCRRGSTGSRSRLGQPAWRAPRNVLCLTTSTD